MKLRAAVIFAGIALVLISVGVTRTVYENIPTPTTTVTVSPTPVNPGITSLPSIKADNENEGEDEGEDE